MISTVYLLSATLLSELFDDKIIDFLIEFDDMVPLVLIVDVTETDLGVFWADLDFNGVLVC